nr:hypothetical protein [Tanacetum cinerariifolium]
MAEENTSQPLPPPIASTEAPQMVSSVNLPILKMGEYILWTMKMEQYLAHTDYALWEVILNGNSAVQITKDEAGNEVKVSRVTAQQILARTRERKAKRTLHMDIPDEHLARFHGIKDAKTLWAAIKTRFGEGLDKGYDRFQRLFSLIEIHEACKAPAALMNLTLLIVFLLLHAIVLRHKVAMLSVRVKRFYKKIRRKLKFNGKEPVGFEKTKVECFNCHRRGHFARDCRPTRSSRNRSRDTGNARYKGRDNGKRPAKEEDEKALVVHDGLGTYEWSYQVEEEAPDFAFMAFTSKPSSSSSLNFEAEAVNTACFVLNKALVTKTHNKTPYELLNGRSPRLDFMRPFGCPVTILNTLDPLGKFEDHEDGAVSGSTDYALWEVILNGNSAVHMTKDEAGNEVKVPRVTAQQILARTRERKAKSTLLMAIPDDHLARFHGIKDAKTLWAAIKTRFGGNTDTLQLDNKNLEQIDQDDLEEMDLKWQVAMLSMKVECFNCHRRGHFARDYSPARISKNSSRDAGNAGYRGRDNEEEATEFAFMAFTSNPSSSSSSNSKGQLRVYQQNKVIYEEKIGVLEYEVKDKSNLLKYTQKVLDKALREKEDLKAKLKKFKTSSKTFTKLCDSQISAKVKTGLGFDSRFNEKEALDVKEEE